MGWGPACRGVHGGAAPTNAATKLQVRPGLPTAPTERQRLKVGVRAGQTPFDTKSHIARRKLHTYRGSGFISPLTTTTYFSIKVIVGDVGYGGKRRLTCTFDGWSALALGWRKSPNA